VLPFFHFHHVSKFIFHQLKFCIILCW